MNLLDNFDWSKLHKKKHFWLVLCVLITVVVLSPNLCSDFLNWDDTTYVIHNDLIKDFSFKGVKNIFTTPEVVSTYAPITLLSWAIDYLIGGLNPAVFHFFNLLLHILVVGLVYYLAKLLSNNKIIAFITALLFGIHPMHVEVVGWISARKDLLYSLFFLGSLIAYYFYIDKKSKYPKFYYYVACLGFFILSLLSKGTAVILPLVLFLFDYLRARKFNMKLILEKVPFLLLSIFFVILAIQVQAKGGAMEDRQFTTVLDSMSVGFYGYLTYLIKSIIPFNLSGYHPYPNQLGESNPWFYYLSAIPVIALFTWLMIKFKKNKQLVFGFGFFFITLIPVIQVLPFGTAVTADRYTYLPYVGLFYLIGVGCVWLYNYSSKLKDVSVFVLLLYLLLLGVISFQYSKTFKSSEKMWTNVIEIYPDNFLAYMNRAEYRISKKEYNRALEDLNLAIKLNPNYAGLYYNRSFIHGVLERNDLVFKDLNRAIQKDPSYMGAYLNRGLLLGEQNQNEAAIKDFTKVIELSPNKYFGYYNRALYNNKVRQYPKAINDLNKIVEMNQFLPESYYLRGKIYVQINDVNNAFKDFSKILEINPYFAEVHTLRGNLWLGKGNFEEALKDFNQAILLDKQQTDAYVNRGVIYMNTGNYDKAVLDFDKAKKNDPQNYLIYYNSGLLYQIIKKHEKAIIEFEKAIKLNPLYSLAKQAREENIKALNK